MRYIPGESPSRNPELPGSMLANVIKRNAPLPMSAKEFPHVDPAEVTKDASRRSANLAHKKDWTAREMRGGHRTARQIESRGRQAEAILMEGLRHWLPEAHIERATEYDDGGGTDIYIEWLDPVSGEECVLSIDVSIGENIETLRKKIEALAHSIEDYDLRTIKYFKSHDGSTRIEPSVPGVAVFIPRESYGEMKNGLTAGVKNTFKDEFVEATIFMQMRSQLAYEIGLMAESFDLQDVETIKKSKEADVQAFTHVLEAFLRSDGDYDADSQRLANALFEVKITRDTFRKIDVLLKKSDPSIPDATSLLISTSFWNLLKNYSAVSSKLDQVKRTEGYRKKAKHPTFDVPRNLVALIKAPSRFAPEE